MSTKPPQREGQVNNIGSIDRERHANDMSTCINEISVETVLTHQSASH